MSDDETGPQSLTLMIGQADRAARGVLESMVRSIGHRWSFSTDSASQLLTEVHRHPPDLVLVHQRMADGSGLEVINDLNHHHAAAAILLIEADQLEHAKRVSENSTAGLLITPTTVEQLRPSIFTARRRFELTRQLARRAHDLHEQLQDGQLQDGTLPPSEQIRDEPVDPLSRADHQDKDS